MYIHIQYTPQNFVIHHLPPELSRVGYFFSYRCLILNNGSYSEKHPVDKRDAKRKLVIGTGEFLGSLWAEPFFETFSSCFIVVGPP